MAVVTTSILFPGGGKRFGREPRVVAATSKKSSTANCFMYPRCYMRKPRLADYFDLSILHACCRRRSLHAVTAIATAVRWRIYSSCEMRDQVPDTWRNKAKRRSLLYSFGPFVVHQSLACCQIGRLPRDQETLVTVRKQGIL